MIGPPPSNDLILAFSKTIALPWFAPTRPILLIPFSIMKEVPVILPTLSSPRQLIVAGSPNLPSVVRAPPSRRSELRQVLRDLIHDLRLPNGTSMVDIAHDGRTLGKSDPFGFDVLSIETNLDGLLP